MPLQVVNSLMRAADVLPADVAVKAITPKLIVADGYHSVCDRNYPAVQTDVTDAVTSKPLLCKLASAASLAASAGSGANHTSRKHPSTPGEVPGLL